MTISKESSKEPIIIATGEANEFFFDLPVFKEEHIVVETKEPGQVKILRELGVDYIVDIDDSSIIFSETPILDTEISISRVLPIIQPTDLIEGDELPAEEIEKAFDRVVMIAQQLKEELGRTLRVDQFTETTPEDLLTAIEGILTEVQALKELTETAATEAQAAQTASEQAEDKAEKWAENPEDIQVEPGKYSAFHWAQKAEKNVLPITEQKFRDIAFAIALIAS